MDVHALLSAPAPRCGRQLAQSELDLLGSQRYVSIPGWLSEAQTDSLQADAMATGACEDAFDCCVGSAAGGPRLDEGVRRSRQCNLYPPPPNAAGSTVARAWLIDAVQALRGELQASVTMALPPLSPFETELAYLMYPVGGHYKRHLDIPRSNDDAGWKLQGRPSNLGGSLCGGRTRRVVSFILYLNRQWDPANGGALRVYPATPYGAPPPPTVWHLLSSPPPPPPLADDAAPTSGAEDIMPEGGTLVLLMSGDVEHMVRETRAERQCVVGWFNEYREERVDSARGATAEFVNMEQVWEEVARIREDVAGHG